MSIHRKGAGGGSCPWRSAQILTGGAPNTGELWHSLVMTDDSIEHTTLRIRIEGAVQGVGYRDFVISNARLMGVSGWVRNRADGSVEALVSAQNDTVEKLVGLCIKGPPGARVANVELHKADAPSETGFRRRPTL